jgi:hypothetical protein
VFVVVLGFIIILMPTTRSLRWPEKKERKKREKNIARKRKKSFFAQ